MTTVGDQLGDIAGHPLSEIGQTRWTPSWQDELVSKCQSLEASIQSLKETLSKFAKLKALEWQTLSLHDLIALDRLADSLMQACEVPSQSVAHAYQQDSRQRLQALIAHGQTRDQISDLLLDYAPEIKSLNAQELRLQWQSSKQYWWPKNWF